MSTAAAGLAQLDARFELRELLGEGGMGAVYLAWDRTLERMVALKFIRGADPALAERLLLEARLQARVEHAHIGKVYEVGEHEGRACIALQLIRGKSLEALASSLPLRERVRLLKQVCEAVHAAHLSGLVHRDIKPGNILVEETGGVARKAFVTDFGLARGPQSSGLSSAGIAVGTLLYMSPEQAAADGPIDFRSDLYSLGATLYALLVGSPPFARTLSERETPQDANLDARPVGASSGDVSMGGFYGLFGSSGEAAQVALLRKVLEDEPRSPRAIDRAVPRDLETIAMRCLRKRPGERYASAAALADDLGRFLEGRRILARPERPFERGLRFLRRHRAAALSALALVLLVALGAVWNARRSAALAAQQRLREELVHRFDQTILDATYRLRLAHMAPLHDRSAQVQALRDSIAAVRADMARLGSIAEGPGHQAIGMGLLELDGYAESSENLEQAWALGVRTPESAEALAWALYLLYSQEVTKLFDLPPAQYKDAKAALEKRTKTRALEILAAYSDRSSERETPFSPALRAALGGDTEAALGRARALLRDEPWHERALFLVFQIRSRLGGHGKAPVGFEQALAESEAALAQLLLLQPSNPDAWHQAWSWAVASATRTEDSEQQIAACRRALEAARNEVAIDPRQARARFDLSKVLNLLSQRMTMHGDPPLAMIAEALQANEQLQSLLPEKLKPDLPLQRANLFSARAAWKLEHGEAADDDLRDFERELDRAATLGTRPIERVQLAQGRIGAAELVAISGGDPTPLLTRARELLLTLESEGGAGGDDGGFTEAPALLALLLAEQGGDPSALLAEAERHWRSRRNPLGVGIDAKLAALLALDHALQDRAQRRSAAAHEREFAEAMRTGQAEAPGDPLIVLLARKARALRVPLR